MQADWELSQSFVSDGQGFRVAGVLPASSDSSAYRIIAGTQGGSLWEFEVPSGNLVPIDYQHNHAITALICGKDVYITGCKDHLIRVFNHEHALLCTFEGHEKAVTSLSLWGDDYLISGSWDGTARVWNLRNKSLVATCAGHENTVSVCAIGCEGSSLIFATGSAGIAQNNVISNHSIRIWTVHLEHGAVRVIHKVSNDHDGPIRDVCLTPQGMLASCSNDGTVKLRSVDTGETLTTLATMVGEAPILLSLASSSSYLAASAEDGHVFVWSNVADTHHVIRHASCVWSVAAVPTNGDLISCCQDGTLRIFTQSTDRMAPAEERDTFANDVKEALQKHKQGPSQEEVSQLPKWEMNALQHGKSDGQVCLFQKDGIAIAAQWSMASQTWIEVGQVMSSSEDAGTIDGAMVTDAIMPLLHKLNLSRVITSSGRNKFYPTFSSLLHIKQRDEWTCGFRNLQMLFSELLPLMPNHHAFFQAVPMSLCPYPHQENRPVPIPSLLQLQTFLEQSWKDGFDAKGAEHYQHRIVGTESWIGAVEVSTILSYLHLDSAVIQFIICQESRTLLGPFVWNYFCRGPCFLCHRNMSNMSCSDWAEQLLYAKEENEDTKNACPCPVLPLYLQWEGHSVTIVGVEKTESNAINFLLFDPMKDGRQLKQALVSNQKNVLAPMRLKSATLMTKDCQVVVCSPRQLTTQERDASRDRPRVVTAASDAVMRFM